MWEVVAVIIIVLLAFLLWAVMTTHKMSFNDLIDASANRTKRVIGGVTEGLK